MDICHISIDPLVPTVLELQTLILYQSSTTLCRYQYLVTHGNYHYVVIYPIRLPKELDGNTLEPHLI